MRLKIYVLDAKYEITLVKDNTMRVSEVFEAEAIQPPAILSRNLGKKETPAGHRH